MHENVSAVSKYAECGRESNKFLLAWLAEWDANIWVEQYLI
jgi:hypothetical protein